MRAMILAAGLGTRMGALSTLCPKPALTVRGVPVIAYLLELLHHHGVREVRINVSHLAHQVERAATLHAPSGLEVSFSREASPLGTGGGIERAADFLRESETSIVLAGDMLLDADLRALARAHVERGAMATLVLRRDPRADAFGTIGVDAAGRVRRIASRFDLGDEHDRGVFSSVRLFSAAAWETLPPPGRFEDLSDWLAPLLTRGRDDIVGQLLPPEEITWEPVGNPAEYLAANLAPPDLRFVDTRALWQSVGARLAGARGDVVLERGARVADGARLERVVVWRDEVVPADARWSDGVFADGRFFAADTTQAAPDTDGSDGETAT